MTENLYVGSRNFLGCQPDKHGMNGYSEIAPSWTERRGAAFPALATKSPPRSVARGLTAVDHHRAGSGGRHHSPSFADEQSVEAAPSGAVAFPPGLGRHSVIGVPASFCGEG